MLHMTCKNPSPNIPDCSSDEDLEQRVEALEECCEEVHTELDTKADAEQINSELESIKAELNALVAGWHYVGDVNNESELPTTITDGEVYYSIDDGGFYVAVGDRYRFISTTPATTEHDGLMSKEDKEKLDNVDTLYKETCGDGEITVTDAEDALLKDLNIELGAPTQAGTPWQDSTKYTDPYLFKACPQIAHEYNREYLDKIVGGTVAWNQIITDNFRNGSVENITRSVSNDEITITSSTDSVTVKGLMKAMPLGHVMLVSGYAKSDGTSEVGIGFRGDGGISTTVNTATLWSVPTTFTRLERIGYATSGAHRVGIMLRNNASQGGYGVFKDICVFDLTQMFGSTIANYIMALETANLGSGVAWFKKLFPKDYYEYNAGELISVSGLESHDTVGFNQWDEEWEVGGYNSANGEKVTGSTGIRAKNFIPILPNTNYCFTNKGVDVYVTLCYYDADRLFISGVGGASGGIHDGSVFTTPSSASYMTFAVPSYGTTYKNDICINLSWSGYRNGEYEPYEKHSYPLDNSLTLRGIPKLDASNNLYYDGDEYASDGSVTRKYGIVDLGTLTWEKHPSMDNIFFTQAAGTTTLDTMMKTAGTFLNTKYPYGGTYSSYNAFADKVAYSSTSFGRVGVKDTAYSTAAEFKTAMSGVYLVYELATPTTETAEAYQNVQICDDFGTEEFVSDSIVPVGTETWYGEVYEITKPTKIQIVQNVKKYGVKWDMANAQMTRTLDAEGITTNVTNFKHNGSVNGNYSNPFDALYPWKDRKLCNIDIDAYRSGSSLKECITHWENDLGFDYNDQYGVWVYTPEFWGRSYIEDGYRYFEIATNALRGYTHYEESIVGRYLGVDITLTIDGASKHCNLPTLGMPMANVSMTNMHTYAQNWGATLNDIYSIDAVSMLYIVEMANMNLQNTLGSGVSSLYLQGVHPSAGSTGNQITLSGLTSAQLSNIIPNAIVDLGTSDGGNQTKRTYITDVSTSGTTTTVTLADSVTVTTATFFSIHGLINVADSEIGSMSGYIGTNSKSNAYYRGQTFYANKFQYILGAYRQQNTGRVWIASKGVTDDYNALDTSVHTDTGLALTQTNGYIKTLGMCEGMGFAPFCTEIGGNATNPVGDYCYVPALSTVNTVLLLGGIAVNGAYCGWYGNWASTAGYSDWSIGSSPRLKTPL